MRLIASYIDHTVLKPDAVSGNIKQLCDEAIKYQFHSVCVNPAWVKFAKDYMEKNAIKITTVIGFPLGANTSFIKEKEAEQALNEGADELDMVINIGWLKNGQTLLVENEIKSIKKIAGNKTLKVIVETCLLTAQEKELSVSLVINGGADFIKTSTGFSSGGAVLEDIELFRKLAGNKLKIKASGGIKNLETFIKMVDAGAGRIGTSSSVKILKESYGPTF